MSKTAATKRAPRVVKSKLPRCLRCDKPVEALTVSPHPSDPGKVIVEFACHGERVSQEMPASLLEGKQGLAQYSVFNAYTSGLMPLPAPPAKASKSKNKGR